MKRKHFILALVAMLSSFSFSTFAATTVYTEAELMNALTTDGEVTLGADINVATQIEISEGKTVVLDLAGYEIIGGWNGSSTTNHIYALSNRGNLTIKDSGTEGKIVSRGIYNYGKLTLESGTIDACDGNGGYAINNESGSTFIMNGGVVSASYEDGDAPAAGNYDATALDVPAGCTATLNGGKITSVTNYTYAISLAGELIVPEISTVEVTGAHGAISMSAGSADIDGGTFICSGFQGQTDNVVYVTGGTMDISGGTFEHTGNLVNANSGAAVVMDGADGVLTISGGEFTGLNGSVSGNANTTLTGGSYGSVLGYDSWDKIKQYVPEGKTVTIEGESYTNVAPAPAYVAKIGDVEYATFAEALTAASAMSGDVTVEVYDKVTLNTAFSGSYSSINFVGKDTDAEIYLDVQGYITATGKKVSFTDLTLSKSEGGFITNAGFMNVAFGIYDVAEVTYTNCVFANGAYASSGNVTFNGCTFYRSHDKYGLWAYGDVNATVEGCTFADYRGIKMYAEGAAKTVDLTVKSTNFSAVTDKPAIVLTYGESVTLEDNTYSSTGTFELDLDGAPNGTAVTSDVAPTCKNDNGACGVLVDGAIYTTVAQAAEAAAEGSNVTLLYSTTDAVEFAEGVNLTLANGVTADNVTVATSGVAKVGDTTYATLAEAVAAAQAGDEIVLLGDVALTETVTLPAGITFNGNGKFVDGEVWAAGNLTFVGHTKVAKFNAGYNKPVITIGEGACLETSSGRMVIGHGATFNITGSIENAKTAEVAALAPSLIIPGASFTGAGVTFNVTNAYISAPSSYCSSSSSASGTFDFNITNSIWESAGKLAFESQSVNATVDFDLKNSVLNTGSHLVFGVSRGEVVIDNSNVNVGTSRQIENRSTMTIKNGSVVNGAVATSSNAINPGSIIVENATYAVTGEFSGAAEGTGTIVIKKGANVSVGSIKAGANVTVDAEGMAAGDEINFTANLSQFTGTLSVINNDKLEASIVDGKVVLAAKPVAKIGEQKFATLQDALDAAAAGTGNVTVEILTDVDLTDVDWNPVTVSDPGYPVVTVEGNDKTITGLNDMLFAGTWAGGSGLIIKNLTIANSAIVNDKDDTQGTVGVGAFIGFPQASATITLENCHLKNSSVEGGHWTGGLIGYAAGYAGTDGPVFMNLTVKDCSVTGSTITGKGSAGGIIGHGSGNAWTNVVIEATTVSGNTITSTGSSTNKAGAVMGTIGAAGQPTTVNGVTHTGGMSVSATVAENDVKSNGTVITTIYGRQGTATGMLAVAGGTYDNYPIEQGVAYAAPAAGYMIEANEDGTYGVVADPAYGKVAKVGDEYFATLQEAINAAQNDETVVLLNTITLADADMVKTEDNRNVMLNISNKSITLDLNENTINIDYNGGQYLFAAVYVADGTGLTVTGNGKIDIAENGINVAYMFWKRGTTGYLTIENGTFHMDDSGDSMVYTNGDEIVTVNGGTFTIDNIDTRPNQFPCIFNAAGQNTANIIVNGGTFNDDVAHQYYPFEVMMPREKALKKSESENLWTVVDAVAYVAEKEGQYINEVGYATLDEAITAAEAGETVTILVGDFTQNLDVQKAITVAGETDAEGNNLVNFAGKLNITADGATVKNINVNNGGSNAGYINAKNVTVDGCQVVGGNGFRSCYTEGTVTFKNSVITGSTYGIHFDGSANGNIVIDNCTITGWTSFAATITKVTMKDTRFDNGNYNYVRFYQGAELTGCSFNEEMNVDFAVDGVEVTVADCTVDGDRTVEDLFDGKDIANSSITVDGVKLARIAKIGDEYYETITAAINAAADGATVEILAGEHSEYVAPWKTDTQHKTEKSITLVGAADFATVLTGGMYLGYDDSQCREHNIVVKGIAFQGKGLTVACQQNVTIEDNKFTDITEGRAIAVIGKDINSVVKNNVIENVASIGIELRNTLTATVEGNTISGTGHNALQITSQVGSTASTATVLNNTMSDWGVNGEGRAMRFEGIVTATVNGNVMTHTAAPEEFAKITNTTALDASANYWNGVSPMTSGMFTGVEGDPIAVLRSYYTDAEKTNLVEFSTAGSAACIGSAYFETLAAAITAAQANDVITFLTDINESVTVNKSVTIDGADKTLTGKITTKGSGATLKITIKNITFDGNNQEYDYAVRADNNSKLVIENCSADNYSYGFLYANKTNDQILVKDVTVKNANYGAHLVSINAATFEDVTVKDGKYGVMIQNQGSRNVVFNNCTMTNVETPLHVWEKGTANITFAFEGTNEMGVEQLSSSQYAVYKNAAMVGTTVYGDLNDAFADENAGTVTLLGNIEMNATAVVGAGKEITLDLNGKTASMADASGATACAIKNNGELTITDGSDTKDGKITFASTTPSANNGYASNAISNYATITIEAGTIENLTVGGACYALDNYAGSTSTINGGKLIAEKTTVRIFNWTDGEAAKATLNVTDGEIISKDGYGINVNSGNTPHVELNISGGVITTDDTDYNLAVYVVNKNSAENFTINVDGGTFNGNFALNGVTSTTMAEGAISVTDGTFEGVICYDEPAYGFITGGTYQTVVEESYCALGYQPVLNEEGTYTVEYTGKVSELTLVDGEFTEFVNEQELTVGTLTYERTLPAAGNWYPLYVPFEVPVEELTALGYEAAFFYDVHFEVLAGGEIDPTSAPDVHLIKIKEGTLKANFPYVIRANASADLNLSLVLENTTLFTTAASAMNSVESGSTINRFIFAGTYKKAKPEELTGDANVPCYVISSRGTFGKLNANTSLSPFRVYMSIIAKDGSPIILNDVAAESISMRVIGEENEDGTTFIYDVEMDGEHTSDYIYDLQGRRVLEPQKGGLYIVNGKKVVF